MMIPCILLIDAKTAFLTNSTNQELSTAWNDVRAREDERIRIFCLSFIKNRSLNFCVLFQNCMCFTYNNIFVTEHNPIDFYQLVWLHKHNVAD